MSLSSSVDRRLAHGAGWLSLPLRHARQTHSELGEAASLNVDETLAEWRARTPVEARRQAANLDPDELSGIERRTLLGTAADRLIPRLTDIGG
jgi:hypothetical protein